MGFKASLRSLSFSENSIQRRVPGLLRPVTGTNTLYDRFDRHYGEWPQDCWRQVDAIGKDFSEWQFQSHG